MNLRKYSKNSEESEKAIEAYLNKRVRECEGLSLKYSSATQTGYPDRILIFPEGTVVWVEIKSKGKHPTPLQAHRIMCLRDLHQVVYVCDSKEKVDYIIENRVESALIRNAKKKR